MAISSIHIENSQISALLHNLRILIPDYLININGKKINESRKYIKFKYVFTNKKNGEEIKTVFENVFINDLIKFAIEDYQKYNKQGKKLPSNAKLLKEAILNINENHNIDDLEKVKLELEKEFGYTITDINLHKDEGYIYTEEKNFVMGRDAYKNKEETSFIAELDFEENKFYEWFLDKNNDWVKGDEIVNYKMHYNYHAHFMIINYDFTKHRTIRNQLKDMSRMQSIVADTLKMTRGKCSSTVEAKRLGVEVEVSRKRLSIKDWKIQKRKERELEKKIETLEKEVEKYNSKDKENEITIQTLYEKIRELIKLVYHETELNEVTKKPLKNKEIVENQLKIINDKDKNIETLLFDNNLKDEIIIKLKTENKNLILSTQKDSLEKKISSIQNISSDYDELKKENLMLKKENQSLKENTKNILEVSNTKIKSLFRFKVFHNLVLKDRFEYLIENDEDWEYRCKDNRGVNKGLQICYDENINNELLKEEDFNNQESEENQESILNSLEDLKMNLEEKTIPIKEQEEAKELFQDNDNLLQI
ncbi:hypothetical protein ACBT_0189 [Aliarcobacter cibarius]|uniref:Plasmid recombination enzyme n=1 Tax=Aliarcobacter cibarius TaxID=255507 RepID=A0A7L5JLT5_9BACT|nr:hypothetical protein [Aliarcobacter cibarius]QKJ26173.1 hypothetical protein ACBT_0189 [Aliarcobacter cibarius]